MKLSDILYESSELEKLKTDLSREVEMFNKIDRPSAAEKESHQRSVSKLQSQITNLKKQPSKSSTHAADTIAASRAKSLETAKRNVEKAERELAKATTERDKKSWRANLAVAKHTLEKAQK